MLIDKIDYKGQPNPEWEKVKFVEIRYCNDKNEWKTTTLQESPEIIQVNEVDRDGKKLYIGTKWDKKPTIQPLKIKNPIPIHTHIINSDKYILQKCDVCGKEYPMNQLEYDSNCGYVCRKCEQETS